MTAGTESIYRENFTQSLNQLFSEAWKVCRNNPAQSLFLLQSYHRQKRKTAIRQEAEKQGILAPPVLIFSMSSLCKLPYNAPYSKSWETNTEELSISRISHLFSEASASGVGVIMLTGGEPLMKPEVLWEAGKQKDIIFPVFTNGTLLSQGSINYFRKNKNLIPVLNTEGEAHRADKGRRAVGYTRLLQHMEKLQKSQQIYGLSLTLTSENFDELTHPVWLNAHRNMGSSLFFMIEYVPQQKSEMKLCLTSEQKALLPGRLKMLRKKIPALFISLPGDEGKYGGSYD